MNYSLKQDGKRIHQTDYKELLLKTGERIPVKCECCDQEVVFRDCDDRTRISHFAHKVASECENWDNKMTEYHIDFQNRFEEQYREVVMEINGEKHRADIKFYNIVLEIQNSKISRKNIIKRNNFYANNNLLIWVFNVNECVERINIIDEKTHIRFEWKYMWRSIFNNLKKNVLIYLDFNDKLYLVKRTKNVNNDVCVVKGIDVFYTGEEYYISSAGISVKKKQIVRYLHTEKPISKDELVNLIKNTNNNLLKTSLDTIYFQEYNDFELKNFQKNNIKL